MSSLRDFHIELERPSATYAPGEIVSGKVLLTISKPKNFREIRLKAKGKAKVYWTETTTSRNSNGQDESTTEYYTAKEDYFRVSNRLEGGSGDDNTTLPAGHHSYPFMIHLPKNLPSSFEHEIGQIRYSLKAVLDRPWRFDHKSVSAIKIIAPYDLNDLPANVTAGINDKIKREFISCCCFNAGSARFNIVSRATAFVPGETIELIVRYDNKSTSVNITKMTMSLKKKTIFYAKSPRSTSKDRSEIISYVRKDRSFDKQGETVLKFDVPSSPLSILNHCSIIKIKYSLIVKIGISGMHRNIKRKYPIELGTVPLRRPQTVLPSAPPIEQVDASAPPTPQPNQQIGFVVTNGPAPAYSTVVSTATLDTPPPSYEECAFGKQ